MTIDIDTRSGFCYGVVRAIQMAEEALAKGNVLYSLGDIVHNEEEVNRLKHIGLHVIDRKTFSALQHHTILIRAHGEPPETYACARRNHNELIDATCPVVLHLQQKVREAWLECNSQNGQIVIYGKAGHAEVNGLVGQTDGHAIVIEKPEDIRFIDVTRPIYLFSQTTQSTDGLLQVSQAIRDARQRAGVPDETVFTVHDTICRQMANRTGAIAQFCAGHDVTIFVGGVKSSNGRILFGVCQKHSPRAHFVSHATDLQPEWFQPEDRVGICGATSTPHWLMHDIADRIRTFGTTHDNIARDSRF